MTTIYVVGTLVTPGQYDDFLNTTLEMRIELCAELTLIDVFFLIVFLIIFFKDFNEKHVQTVLVRPAITAMVDWG